MQPNTEGPISTWSLQSNEVTMEAALLQVESLMVCRLSHSKMQIAFLTGVDAECGLYLN